ncbi:DNA-binding SARP family transcriptional activator [Lentzea atacamensis]|uniref:DNA-binding SARP family transcriptional activator n=1 Tax=Lentzea atacamensis TaxID=531938 RepID=A0ABX9E4J4_9PSEU|nr:BTAD domain-containing putative transcriptional regulator [Lentzea atacamensis]RAS62598.1 DNA-binding SARP family transcriptional activator [Lentzea atacamensis]
MSVEFRVLGDVEVRIDGQSVDAGRARQLCVLVALLHDVRQPIPVERILSRVWGDDPPNRGKNVLYGYLSRLRRALAAAGDVTVARQHAGYVLTADPMAVDLHRFRELVAQARTSDDDQAVLLFNRALALWRGRPFGGLSTPWLDELRATLESERFAVVLDRNEVALRLGRQDDVLGEMFRETTAHPLDERLAGQVILALHKSGRHADADRHYAELSRRLADELGVDPSPAVREQHEQSPAALKRRPDVPVPRQLPAHSPFFVGRDGELEVLDDLLRRHRPFVAISGAAGVGKTTLAVHWAHRVQDSFPDGQLYVNLRGFEHAGAAVSPAEALRTLLTMLGVPPDRAPSDIDAMAATYRSILNSRRLLILLDNARDVQQVRPLLPGDGVSMVVVTSRNHLVGLVAGEGAHLITLRHMDLREARALLEQHLGRDRMEAETQAVDELIAGAGFLPLALAVVAARASLNPTFSLKALAGELDSQQSRLDTLDDDDPKTSVRAAISLSCRHLGPTAAQVFRLLGLHPGPAVTAAATASLAGLSGKEAEDALDELARVHLTEEHRPGRFAFHDLVRVYAAERFRLEVPAPARNDALRRLLDHYLHTAVSGALLLRPMRDHIDVDDAAPGTCPEPLSDYQAAWRWLEDEIAALRRLLPLAAAEGFDQHVWQLAWTTADFLDRQGRWHDWIELGTYALAAGARLADRRALASAHRGLGQAFIMLRSFPQARAHLMAALDLDGTRVGEAGIHRDLALMADTQGSFTEALEHGRRALEIYRNCGHLAGEAAALNQVGWYLCQLGSHRRALVACEEALVRHRGIGDWTGEAVTWDSLGFIHHNMGANARAIECYERALALYRELGDVFENAATLTRLADTHLAEGETSAARDALRSASALLDNLRHPDARAVHARLEALDAEDERLPGPRA